MSDDEVLDQARADGFELEAVRYGGRAALAWA
jgi:hypothetical protein